MSRRLPPPLIALSPGTLRAEDCQRFTLILGRAFEAGLRGFILREQLLSDRVFSELLERVLVIRRASEAWVGVHDRAHLAATQAVSGLQPDGLHLGFKSLSTDLARTVVGQGIALGLSTHAQDDPGDWVASDYLFHGPVLATPSKVGLKEPVEFDGLVRAVQSAQSIGAGPVWAIGGLRPEHAGRARAAGAAGLAVLRGILSLPDPAPATEAYLTEWDSA